MVVELVINLVDHGTNFAVQIRSGIIGLYHIHQ